MARGTGAGRQARAGRRQGSQRTAGSMPRIAQPGTGQERQPAAARDERWHRQERRRKEADRRRVLGRNGAGMQM